MDDTLTTLPITALIEDPDNIRTEFHDLEELAATIRSAGLLQPLLVHPTDDPNVYMISDGARRYRACKLAKLRDVPVMIRREGLSTRQETVTAMVITGLQKQTITPVEEANAYQLLLDEGMTPARVAKATGRPKTVVTGRLALRSLGAEEQGKLHTGDLTLDVAEALAEFAGEPDVYKSLAEVAGTYNWDWKVKEARNRRRRTERIAELTPELEAQGVPILDSFPGYGGSTLPVDALVDAETGEHVDRDKHASCPGRAVFFTGNGELGEACQQHDEHGHITTWAWARKQSVQGGQVASGAPEQADVAEIEYARRREALETAGQVRRDYLARFAQLSKPPAVAGLLLALVFVSEDWDSWATPEDAAVMVGVHDLPDDRAKADLLARMPEGRRIVGAAAAAALGVEQYLAHTGGQLPHVWKEPPVIAYLDLLEHVGWAPSEVEREEIAKAGQGDEDGDQDDEKGPQS